MIKIKDLKVGAEVGHPKYGTLQYMGKATKHPYTRQLQTPTKYIFWQGVDENGNNQPDIVIKDGDEQVELYQQLKN